VNGDRAEGSALVDRNEGVVACLTELARGALVADDSIEATWRGRSVDTAIGGSPAWKDDRERTAGNGWIVCVTG
jgi:hypothetical protein